MNSRMMNTLATVLAVAREVNLSKRVVFLASGLVSHLRKLRMMLPSYRSTVMATGLFFAGANA